MRERPLVDLSVPSPPEEVLDRLKEGLVSCEDCEAHFGRREVSFTVAEKHRHTWSPYLSLEVRPSEDGARLRGRFGPEPHLWTMFVAIYASFVVTLIAGTVYGMVELSLGLGTYGLYVIATSILGLTVSCSIDLAGRRYGSAQMAHIRGFIHQTLPDAEIIEETT